MIQLTTESRQNKNGEVVDTSLYLIRFDSRNLAIVRGNPEVSGKNNVVGYYGSVKNALTKCIDIVIKNGSEPLSIETLLNRIIDMERRIEELYSDIPTMISMVKGE